MADIENEKSNAKSSANGLEVQTSTKERGKKVIMKEEIVVDSLKKLKEEVGQISELSSEEENVVRIFSLTFLKLLEPLTKALPVNVTLLPNELGSVAKANVLPKGDLVILFTDGRMESIDLTENENRDLLVIVISDVMPRLNDLISQRREKIERRITFLTEVTKELQIIVDSITLSN